MHTNSIPKTAVITPFGLFEWTKMPFGLMNSGTSPGSPTRSPTPSADLQTLLRLYRTTTSPTTSSTRCLSPPPSLIQLLLQLHRRLLLHHLQHQHLQHHLHHQLQLPEAALVNRKVSPVLAMSGRSSTCPLTCQRRQVSI